MMLNSANNTHFFPIILCLVFFPIIIIVFSCLYWICKCTMPVALWQFLFSNKPGLILCNTMAVVDEAKGTHWWLALGDCCHATLEAGLAEPVDLVGSCTHWGNMNAIWGRRVCRIMILKELGGLLQHWRLVWRRTLFYQELFPEEQGIKGLYRSNALGQKEKKKVYFAFCSDS